MKHRTHWKHRQGRKCQVTKLIANLNLFRPISSKAVRSTGQTNAN